MDSIYNLCAEYPFEVTIFALIFTYAYFFYRSHLRVNRLADGEKLFETYLTVRKFRENKASLNYKNFITPTESHKLANALIRLEESRHES